MFDKIIAAVMSFLMLFSSSPLSFYNSDRFPTTMLAFIKYYANSQREFEIPDICGDFVPQGLCYSKTLDKYLVTGYMEDGTASPLYVVNAQTGETEKKVLLYESEEKEYTGHAGGIAAYFGNAWVVSGGYARRIALADISAAQDSAAVVFADSFNTGTRASYAACTGNILWVGEYYKPDSDYITSDEHHLTATDGKEQCAWTCGYILSPENPQGFTYEGGSEVVVPNYVLSTEDSCQGFTRLSDGRFVTSISGSALSSSLNCYKNVLKNEPDKTVEISGSTVPLWFLDGNARESKLSALPRSEGLQYMPESGKVLVLYESASAKMYCTSFAATKYVWAVDKNVF